MQANPAEDSSSGFKKVSQSTDELSFADAQLTRVSLPKSEAEGLRSPGALQTLFVDFMRRTHIRRCMAVLDLPTEASVTAQEPSLKAFSNRFDTRIPVMIFSNSGYNFSAEYEIIYNGSSPFDSTHKDFKAVLERAFLTLDPTLSPELLDQYSRFTLYHVLHLESMAAELSNLSFAQNFPGISLNPLLLSSYYPTRVYLGMGMDQQICCWVRVCCESPRFRGNPVDVTDNGGLMYFAVTAKYQISDASTPDSFTFTNKSSKVQCSIKSLSNTSVFLVSSLERRTGFDSGLDESDGLFEEKGGASLETSEQNAFNTLDDVSESGASFSLEVFAWGSGGAQNMSLLQLPPSLVAQKIRMIACSDSHCLVLSCSGAVFAYGDNDEGALGLGDLAPRQSLTLVEFPSEAEPPVIHKVAAGSCVLGSHSLALDAAGRIYSFGVAYACGHSSLKPCLRPKELKELPQSNPKNAYGRFPVRDIACGGGFSVAVMDSGVVCSWGLWAHGRLGLGRPKPLNVRGKSRMTKYQMSPKMVEGVSNIIAIATGDSHTLCITGGGDLYAWGGNSLGQIGVGCHRSGFLLDQLEPVLVRFADGAGVSRVTCGANHSLAIDVKGRVWSWGAGGGPALGLGGRGLQAEWEKRLASIFHPRQAQVMIPCELVSWSDGWARPALVSALSGKDVTSMSAGARHSAFVTNNGRIYLCGEEPIVPPFISNVYLSPEDNGDTQNYDDEQPDNQIHRIARSVNSPRCPSAAWLSKLSSRRTTFISSFGERMFVAQDEDLVSMDLGEKLLGVLQGSSLSSDVNWELDSLDSFHMLTDEPPNNALNRRGVADSLIITSGRTLLGHQALLSRRSVFIRDLIINESTLDGSNSVTHILLPELRYETAKALIYFLYTDKLHANVMEDIILLYSLNKAAKMLKIPRLSLMTDTLINILSDPILEEGEPLEYEVPPCTLAKDFSTLVGDPTFADLRFTAEGRTIYAHKFILQSRCQYFQVMFTSGMMESVVSDGLIDISVPGADNLFSLLLTHIFYYTSVDTFVGFLRLLVYLYTSSLPEGTDGLLLEDMMAADRYNISDMKLQAESMLEVNDSNWLDVLRAATIMDVPKLLADVKTYTLTEYDTVCAHPAFNNFKVEFPELFMELDSICKSVSKPPLLSTYSDRVNDRPKEKQRDSKFSTTFPLWTIPVLILFTLLYQHFVTRYPIGPWIPALNVAVLGGLITFVYRFATSKA